VVIFLPQLLGSLNRQELSVDMWALSKLRLEPGDQWLDEYFDATEAQLTRFTLRVRPRNALLVHLACRSNPGSWQGSMIIYY
jgi:hypothetical protein